MRTSLALTRLPFGKALQAVLLSSVAALLPGSLYAQAESGNTAYEEPIEKVEVIGTRQIIQSTIRMS